jgi:hypothetical protein
VATQKSIIDNILSSKYYLNEGEPLKITGYNYELKIDFEHITEITLTNGDVWVFDPTKHNNIIININGKKQAEIDIRNKILQLDSLLNAEAKNKSETEEGFVENDYSLNQEQLSTTIHINESYDALLIYESIVANHMVKHGTIQIPEWKAKVLIR